MVRCLSTYIANSTKSDVLEVMGIERDLFGTFAQYERPYSPAVPAQVEELDLGLFIEAHGRRACEARVVCQGQPALAFDAGVPVCRLCGDARRIDRLVQTQLQWRAASRQGGVNG